MTKLFQGKKVAVLGLGLSGLATVRFLLKHGVRPTLMDTRLQVSGLDAFSQEKVDGIYFGELDANRLANMDIVVVSPGLDLRHPAIRFAVAQGTLFIGDVELFAQCNHAPVVAITGSNGKSTVTSLTALMLQCSGLNAVAAGNIGLPVLDALQLQETQVYVLELSSFQLDTTHHLPLVAAAHLNLSADHLDRHGTLAAYAAAKQRIYRHCQRAIFNCDDVATCPAIPMPDAIGISLTPLTATNGEATQYGLILQQQELWFVVAGELLMPVAAMNLVGRHNQFNALTAAALAMAAGATRSGIQAALQSYQSLPHRCTLVANVAGVRWVNDSKATNIGATLAAIAGLRPDVTGKLILIAGGDGKGADLSELSQTVQQDVDVLITLGQDGPAIAALRTDALQVSSLDEAVRVAAQHATAGDLVLLSPACASLDMFKNYEHRGEQFAAAVKQVLS